MSVTPSSPRRQTADEFARRCRTDSTKRAYAADWRDFNGWCQANGETALPARPATIGRYLADRAATHRPQTLKRHLAAIIILHRQAGHAIDRRDPAIADVLRGINRTIGTAPVQKDPLIAEDIRQLVAAQPTSLAGLRDRAVLLLGFSGAFRRSELAALTTRDLVWTSDGLAVMVRRAKDDQEAQGHLKAIPFGSCEATCPVRAVRHWIMTARLGDGPLFRRIDRFGNLHAAGISGEAIADIVKRAVARAAANDGWSKAEVDRRVAAVAGHSLRAGFVTSAARAKVSEREIMRHTGHKQPSTLRHYIRQGDMFESSPVRDVDL